MEYDPLLEEDDLLLQPFHRFFRIETAYMASEGYYQNERVASFRQYAVSLIEEISKCEDFDAFVPYLAMNYFDRFISRHDLPKVIESNDEENAKLLVICCLTIARKMRIKSFNADQFLKERNFEFGRMQVRRMELLILDALQWRMRSLTPICFAGYFIPLLRLPPPNEPLTRLVYQIIIRAQADIQFTQDRPSIVAASAVLIATLKLSPAQFYEFEEIVSSCIFIRKKELWRCIEAMDTFYIANGTFCSPNCQWTNEELSSRIIKSELDKSGPRPIDASTSSQRAADRPRAGSVEAPTSLLLAALPPGYRSELKMRRRLGKEPVGDIQEIQPVASDQHLDFELNWTDTQRPKVTIASILPALLDTGPPPSSIWLAKFSLNQCCPILNCFTNNNQNQ